MKKVLSFVLALCIMVSAAVSASAATKDFSDVSKNRWSYKAVNHAREMKYVVGVGNNKFDPTGKITYGQLAQILYNKAGRPEFLCYGRGLDTWEDAYCTYGVAGGISSVSEAEAWKAGGDSEYDKYVDLMSEDFYDEYCGQLTHDDAVLYGHSTERSRFMDACQKGKWYTKAYTWCYGLGMVRGKATDFATRGDVLKGLVAVQYYLTDGQDSMKLAFETEDGTEYVWIGDDDAYLANKYDYNRNPRSQQTHMEDWLSWAFRMGLIAGDGSMSTDEPGKKDLKLEKTITREEVSQFLYNFDDGRIERETAKVHEAYAPIAANRTKENSLVCKYGLSHYKDTDVVDMNDWECFIPYNFTPCISTVGQGFDDGYTQIYADQLYVYPSDSEGKYRGYGYPVASYCAAYVHEQDRERAKDLFAGSEPTDFIGYEIMWRDRSEAALAIHNQGVREGWFNGSY